MLFHETSHHPILQSMGIKTKQGGPGPFYHHMNDADVYLGGWEGGGGGGVTNPKNTICAFASCPEDQTERAPPTSQTFKTPVLGQTQHEKASNSFSFSPPPPPSTYVDIDSVHTINWTKHSPSIFTSVLAIADGFAPFAAPVEYMHF